MWVCGMETVMIMWRGGYGDGGAAAMWSESEASKMFRFDWTWC
jgi:hypothetical protein